MEVRHPHSEGKRLRHYLFEFFMLFLAVFCGFLAENFREHRVEKNREKEYMQEIIQNLQYDTTRCELNKQTNIIVIRGLDSLRMELKNAVHGKIEPNTLYYFSHYTGNISVAVFNTSAMTELKSSGSLRLVSNKNLVTELSDYYERKVSATNIFIPSTTDITNLQYNIFSLVDLDDYVDAYDSMQATTYDINYNYRSILNHKPELTLLSRDPVLLEKYYTRVSWLEINIKRYDFGCNTRKMLLKN